MLTAETITDAMIRELRDEQKARYRANDYEHAEDLDYSFAAICGRESIVGLFTGERITREQGIERCVVILTPAPRRRAAGRGEMDDETRIAKAVKSGGRMLGPLERQRCNRHPRRWTAFRWVWTVGGDISAADVESVRPCAQCLEDDRNPEDE